MRRALFLLAALVSIWGCGSNPAHDAKTCGSAPAGWSASLGAGERLLLRTGWLLQSSAAVADPPEVISTTSYTPTGWYSARVPSTVVGALVEGGIYPDPFTGMNLRSLPGMGYGIGEVFTDVEMPEDSPFSVSWWYRTELDLPIELAGGKVWLTLDGINYRANVWLNGEQVADSSELVGAYTSFELDVTCAARPGEKNVLAIQVFPPRVGDLAHTWVDWNPTPPDKNMGLWRDVWVAASGPVVIRNPQVRTRLDLPSLDVAHLEVTAELRNASAADVSGSLRGTIGEITFEAPVTVPADSTRVVTFSAPQYPQLDVARPALWWPAQYGTPNLHTVTLEVVAGTALSDRSSVRFGMREVTSELTPAGYRVFSVNGRKILVRGAGWARNMFLMEPPGREDREMSLVRDLGLNTVRFEGKFPSDHLLDLADELGVLAIHGWCCCDAWERTSTWGDEQRRVAESSMRSMARRLRNRPSVLTWLYGSDGPPGHDVEAMYLRVLAETSWPNPAQSSAKEFSTELGGPSGLKMLGPYQWVPPSYWLADERLGGAFGFATEISPGPAVPEVESLRKMLGAEHLWPMDEVWDFHAGSSGFRDIDVFTAALEGRYGAAADVEDFARKAQAMTYEAERAMFEAYGRRKYVATGVIQWMLNNAWPSLIWHLYDYYLAAGGGYYGTKKALEPLHVQYSPEDRTVVVVNSGLGEHAGISVRAQVLALDGSERYAAEAPLYVGPDSNVEALVIPDVANLSPAYFVRVDLLDTAGTILSTNFYWFSTSLDVVDWENADWFSIPTLAYADLTALADLPAVSLDLASSAMSADGEGIVTVTVTNPGPHVAFMVRLALSEREGGPEVLPTRWQDNFFSLLPGEARTVTARYSPDDAHGAAPVVKVGGWNIVPSST